MTETPTWLDSVFERLYRRAGRHYLTVLVGSIIALVHLVVIPLYVGTTLPLFASTDEEFVKALLVFEAALAPAGFVILAIFRHRQQPMTAWIVGARGPEAAVNAWRSVVVDLPRTVSLGVAIYGLAVIPPAIWIGIAVYELSPLTWVLYAIYVQILVMGVGVLGYFFMEQGGRAVAHETATALRPGFERPAAPISLSRKLLILLPAISLYGSAIVGAFAQNSSGRDGRIAAVIVSALLVSATLSLLLTLLFRNSLLQRLNDLRRAHARIAEGDLDVSWVPMAGDELDEVGDSFNEMVDGLRERESLRDRNAELADALRESRSRIVVAADESRRRVERDLHDGAQQTLVLLKLKLGMLERQLRTAPEEMRQLANDVRDDLDRALVELRDLAHGIYPQLLTSDGLAAALAEAADQAALPVELTHDGVGRYPAELEAAVYFCCLEALQNAAKHAGEGATATVSLTNSGGRLGFQVTDDGAGFDADGSAETAGLQNMADRIGALGGELRVDSARGRGTSVSGRIPLGGNGPR